jgi:ubiquinone biosynthesis protein COQ4
MLISVLHQLRIRKNAMSALPLCHPQRRDAGFRPVKAWRHFRALIANKEDTEQVFHIIEALRDGRFAKRAQAFFDSPAGKEVLATNEFLPALLDNHAALMKLPEGSVGRAYVEFMQREGLTAQGLVDEFDKFRAGQPRHDDLLERYGNRLRDTHDLFHVLTGYGRDALGEQCVLAFSYSQTPSWGVLFIAWAGARELKHQVPVATNIYAAVREGQRSGKAALRIAEQDIGALLAEPLAVARKRLGIIEPIAYRAAHARLRANGIDPYDLFGRNSVEDDVQPVALARAA